MAMPQPVATIQVQDEQYEENSEEVLAARVGNSLIGFLSELLAFCNNMSK